MLVAAGASLSIKDRQGNTPMMVAFNVDAHDLASYLESKLNFFPGDLYLFVDQIPHLKCPTNKTSLFN